MKNKAMPTKKIIEIITQYYPEVNLAYSPNYHECYRIRATKDPEIKIRYADTSYPKHTRTYKNIGQGVTQREAWVRAMNHVIKEHNLDY
jgi:hypothetical protein